MLRKKVNAFQKGLSMAGDCCCGGWYDMVHGYDYAADALELLKTPSSMHLVLGFKQR